MELNSLSASVKGNTTRLSPEPAMLVADLVQHTDNRKGVAIVRENLAYGIDAAKQFHRHLLAYHRHKAAVVQIGLGNEASLPDSPGANVFIAGGCAYETAVLILDQSSLELCLSL